MPSIHRRVSARLVVDNVLLNDRVHSAGEVVELDPGALAEALLASGGAIVLGEVAPRSPILATSDAPPVVAEDRAGAEPDPTSEPASEPAPDPAPEPSLDELAALKSRLSARGKKPAAPTTPVES